MKKLVLMFMLMVLVLFTAINIYDIEGTILKFPAFGIEVYIFTQAL